MISRRTFDSDVPAGTRSGKPARRIGALCAVGLLLAACGSDDEGSATATESAPADATAAAQSTEPTEPTESSGSSGVGSAPASAGFPVTFETKFGPTTIESKPERVVSVGYTEGDLILALGVTPVGLRDWYGDQPNALWPWAAESPAAQAGEIEVLPSAALNFEQIKDLEPDVIFAIGSGITQTDFDTLSGIAPTVAQSDEYNDFGTPWDVTQLMIGKALGLEAEAQALVDGVNAKIADVVAAHPEWQGKTGVVAVINADGSAGVFTDGDNRGHLLHQLGFTIPDEITEIAAGEFYANVSAERLDLIDTDLLAYTAYPASERPTIDALPTVQGLDAIGEGRFVFLDDALGGAMAFASTLSIPYTLGALVPAIEAALANA